MASNGRTAGRSSGPLRTNRGRRRSPDGRSSRQGVAVSLQLSEQLALNVELSTQSLVDVTGAVRDDGRQKAGLGVARIVPARISGDRVPADAANIGALAHCVPHPVGD